MVDGNAIKKSLESRCGSISPDDEAKKISMSGFGNLDFGLSMAAHKNIACKESKRRGHLELMQMDDANTWTAKLQK